MRAIMIVTKFVMKGVMMQPRTQSTCPLTIAVLMPNRSTTKAHTRQKMTYPYHETDTK